ncbi:MAG TPA: sigma-70 family RNA polymerase sigma factor [Terriglobales bacterium]|nr:sigma-70 family RNA polymerase sigma factor [Terriglobales bacterium]
MAAESIPPLARRDSELVLRVRAGERQLFHELVRPYERAVFIATYGILRDHADAEEAAQETMLKALMHLDQLADPEKFKGWLLQIAVNEARLKRRGKHASLFEPLDGNANPNAEEAFMPRDFADWRELPSDAAERREIGEHIARALHSLPDIYRETFVLRDVEQLSATECAAILGIGVPAVKVRLHRARLMMRESLTPVFGKPKTPFWERLKGKNPWSAAKR